ncbi:MAG: cell division protein SepF [Candidatus Diapherotrites archaeon]
MAFASKLFKKEPGIDVEEFLNTLDVEEEAMYEDADAFVKPMTLSTQEDAAAVMKEARDGNIVLLNIEGLAKRNAIKLKELITSIKNQVMEIDGDIARISTDRVLITPSRVKIVKQKEK